MSPARRSAAISSLTDHNGKPRTLADYRGKAVVMFFGYTQCPDVCPTTLSELAEAMKRLGADADRVQVLFVTVDPERDTQDLLSKYVPAFDPRFVGLYGDADATARTAKEFKVIYQKQPGADARHLHGRSFGGNVHLRPERQAARVCRLRAGARRVRARYSGIAPDAKVLKTPRRRFNRLSDRWALRRQR